MEIYNYDKITNEFLSTFEARPNPMEEGEFLIPANATAKPLPVLATNEAAVFNIGNDDWTIVSDYRDEVYYLKVDGSKVDFELGDEPNAAMQKTFPAAVKLANDKASRKIELETEADNLIDAQSDSDPRAQRKMLRKAISMIDKQANRGMGRNPMLNQLAVISDYADLVDDNLDAALVELETSTDPASVVLVHPPLPA